MSNTVVRTRISPPPGSNAWQRYEYCHAPEAVFNFSFEVEHVVPVVLGGRDEESNLALACRPCNLLKAAFVTGTDEESQEMVRLFHPREDGWADHFCVGRETGQIVGLTPTGRATVARLQMNHALQRAARHQWMRLDLFP